MNRNLVFKVLPKYEDQRKMREMQQGLQAELNGLLCTQKQTSRLIHKKFYRAKNDV